MLSFGRISGALGVALLSIVPATAQGEGLSDGLYLKGVAGFSLPDDTSFTGTGGSSGSIDLETGYAAGLALGYAFTDNIIGELEYMYRSADIDSVSNTGFATGGDLASVIVTANALYQFDGWDMPVGDRFRPFLGLGIGVTQEADVDFSGGANTGSFETSGDFVYQLRAGANWELDANWVLSSELRYMDAGSLTFDAENSTGSLSADYQTTDLLFGIAYRF